VIQLKKYKYEEMLPNEFLKAVEDMPVFIVPTGLLEWHGDHNPLGLDTLKVYELCLRAAKLLDGGIVLPPNYYGRPGFSSYTGTLTYSEGCLNILFTELFYQLKKAGAKVIALITGHYGDCQVDFIKRVAANFESENPDIKILAMPEYEDTLVDNRTPADHGGFFETSMMMAVDEKLVDMSKAKTVPRKDLTSELIFKNGLEFRGVKLPIPFRLDKITHVGNYGAEAEKANVELGRKMFEVYVDYCAGLAEELRKVIL
jgi:creatinine amidohydrolase